jgi:hypothetical protein
MLLEQRLNFVSGSLSTRNFDTIHGVGGDVNHFLELRMFKGLNQLQKVVLLDGE